ncbi:MAG: basic rane protein [Clostridiales bacterium]|jgi:basic membrane protein A|nr:basic rane protein [Clostridiales bacterium]
MKRRVAALFLAIAMVAGMLAGCGSSQTSATAASQAEGTTQAATQAETQAPDKTYKVAMILDSSIADGGWGAACYNAMVAAAAETGFETQYTDGLATADFASSIRSYCDLGFDLIFAPGNQYSDAVKEVAADYPDVDFALLNGVVETENITSLLPDAEQIGYMAGALAGLMSKTNSIGFIGGLELDTTKMKLAKYEEAAKAVNPDITVYSAYAGSFSDTAKGMEIAESMISLNDVDVMFGDASAVDSGAREVLANYEDKYDIGQPGDLLATQESTVIIGSVVTDNARMLKICMEEVMSGEFGNKTIYGNLENGSLSVGTFSDAVPEDIKAQYLEIVEQIKEGTFIQ